MNKNIKFTPAAIKDLAAIIASRNPLHPNYLKGPELVLLFNNLGFPDAYTFESGIGIQTPDYGNGLSRLNYTLKRLNDLNNSHNVFNAIEEFLKVIKQPQEAIESINNIFGQPIQMTFDKANKATNKVEVKDDFDFKTSENVRNSTVSSEQSDLAIEEPQKTIVKEVLGNLPSDRPIVFISYSWDSEEHRKWVIKLADDLTHNGIFVLIDAYQEGGTKLSAFMDLGIEYANKVLIIGTPTYKIKSYTQSGVGFEGFIITQSIYHKIGTKKFLPCLRSGDFEKSFPLLLSDLKGYDFSNNENYDRELESLCREIYNKPLSQRPSLGDIPDYAK